MPTVSGNVTIRAASQDTVTWQLVQSDGSTVIDLTNATAAALRMVNNSGERKEFLTTGSKFAISDAANGKVKLSPATTDFTETGDWQFYVEYTDSSGIHTVPENKNDTLRVIANIAAP